MESITDEVLARVFKLTEAMEAAAAEGDWPRAAALAEERSPLLMSLAPAQTPQTLSVIRTIQGLDSALAQRASESRDALSTQMQQSMQRIKAASSYQKMGRL